jgi:hypothetical protein
MKGNINAAGEARITVISESSTATAAKHSSTDESDQFMAFATKLVQVPKSEIDEQRQEA